VPHNFAIEGRSGGHFQVGGRSNVRVITRIWAGSRRLKAIEQELSQVPGLKKKPTVDKYLFTELAV
jgi:hypothetical protein